MKIKRFGLVLVCILFAFTISACAVGAGAPVSGTIFTKATGPYMATQNQIGSKKGEATAVSILGLIGTGDAGIAAAAQNGNITKVATVDQQGMNVLGVFATSTTVVTGE